MCTAILSIGMARKGLKLKFKPTPPAACTSRVEGAQITRGNEMTTARTKRWWIKERQSQSLHYFVACGQLSKTAAKRMEKPLAGYNTMHGYDTEAEYMAKIDELRAAGHSVQ